MSDATPRPPRRLRTLLAACAALLTACAAPLPHTRTTATPRSAASSGATTAVADVAGAEALVFANRYDDADTAYAQLASARPGDSAVHASWALFLNYRLQSDAAAAEARRAVAAGPASARAHAVLCRVDDWANHLDDAVREGRRATGLDAHDPLGHLFLSEALADHGDLSGARTELASAGTLIGAASPEYLRAEIHREEGNLAHDAGDLAAEVSGYRGALQAQPTWVERPSELAGAYLDSGDLAGAHDAIATAVRLTPNDAGLLASLGRIAMFQQDYATAADADGRLVALRPRDSTAALLDAHAHFVTTHDLDGTVARLQHALTLDPGSRAAAAYLEMVEANVRGDAARGLREVADAVAAAADDGSPRGGVAAVPDLEASRQAHAAAAVTALNTARRAAGLAAVSLDAHLTLSALNHCFYWLFNNGSPSVAKLGIHDETPGDTGYTGSRPGDRARAAGYPSSAVAEDITHAGDPALAVGQWVDSVYHRFPMMRADLVSIGYADCAVGPLPMEDMEFGYAGGNPGHAPVLYPGDGQAQVPAVFVDNELPDPVPAGRPRTTGYPLTVTFAPLAHVGAATLTLTDPGGTALAGYAIAPDRNDGNTASLVPVAPLTSGATYTAHVTATVDGTVYEQTWSFSVA